jgi:tricorn protease
VRNRLLAVALLAFGFRAAGATAPLLLRKPTVSRTDIVFTFAGDLWIVPRAGGDARRLTAGIGVETDPVFSPDGSMLAFTGEYDGNVDVYVVAAGGGDPRRLTRHPGPDIVLGWTPDGASVLFKSARASETVLAKLFTVPAAGGFPSELPLPSGDQASFSPDGKRLAYVPIFQWQRAWKRYRGGQTTPIWIADLADSKIEKIPRDNSNDKNPMWVGDTVYFLSDREGPVTLFAYDTKTKAVRRVVENHGLDIKSAGAGEGTIVYEAFGSLHLLDLAKGSDTALEVRVAADLHGVRPHWVKLEPKRIRAWGLSPGGARAVFEARGEILTVPAEKGDFRNLTKTPDVAEREPSWSPDGKWIACFSDASGEYELELLPQGGGGEPRRIPLGTPPSFFYEPTWSPDGKRIAYTDKRRTLWVVDVAGGAPRKIDVDKYETPFRSLSPAWSPDGKWLAYAKALKNHLNAVYLHSLEKGTTVQVTDGMSDATRPVFDGTGKYLYFLASTDVGPASSWLDMSSINRPVTRSVYLAVLRKDLPSPLAPESDEETGVAKKEDTRDEKKDGDKKTGNAKPEPFRVDVEGLDQRVLALTLPPANYDAIFAAKEGVLFVTEAPAVLFSPSDSEDPPKMAVQKLDLKTRKPEKWAEGVTAFTLSRDGEKALFRQGDSWTIAATDKPPKAGEGALKLAGVEVFSDPRAEWKQMYHEVWRIERDFLYDPGYHGLDLAAAERKYAPYLEGVASRGDLNTLFEEMLGELTLGHVFVGRGDRPEPPKVKGGLLGADYAIENGRYRFRRVYSGENWNPDLKAPLTQPGVNVGKGEYLLAVDGRELHAKDDVDAFLEETAGRSVVLRVGPSPDGKGARDVTVVPVESEEGLRNLAWIEGNRRRVDELSKGRVAYVYLPNTAGAGYTNFNRYFFAQVGKDAVVIDERFNEGGDVADYVIDFLRRPLMALMTTRDGEEMATPGGAIFGPKVMLVNEMAGSGGDALPWMFKRTKLGPLVGKRTWGGLVGIYDYPELLDGGRVTAPRIAIYGLEGEWEVENHGIAPDFEVEMDPKLAREGHDPQLEKGVAVALELLEKNPLPKYKRPAYPNYQKVTKGEAVAEPPKK